MERTVSFKIESAPSSGRHDAGHNEKPTMPRTAPIKSRPGILRTPSAASKSGSDKMLASEGLQISGQKLATKDTKANITVEHHDKGLDPGKVAADLRLTTSHKMHEEVKCLRYESSKIRETLLKVEEEVSCLHEVVICCDIPASYYLLLSTGGCTEVFTHSLGA